MYKIGDVVVCIDNEPKQDYVFYDFVSYMLEFHKINPLEINKTYTMMILVVDMKALHIY